MHFMIIRRIKAVLHLDDIFSPMIFLWGGLIDGHMLTPSVRRLPIFFCVPTHSSISGLQNPGPVAVQHGRHHASDPLCPSYIRLTSASECCS